MNGERNRHAASISEHRRTSQQCWMWQGVLFVLLSGKKAGSALQSWMSRESFSIWTYWWITGWFGEWERANLVVQLARFSIYIYIYIYLSRCRPLSRYRIVLNVSAWTFLNVTAIRCGRIMHMRMPLANISLPVSTCVCPWSLWQLFVFIVRSTLLTLVTWDKIETRW